MRWLETATVPLAELARPGSGAARVRAMLDRLSRKQDGKPTAANTANRKRIVLNNAMEYACESGRLSIDQVILEPHLPVTQAPLA